MNDGEPAIIIEPPFTISFTINRQMSAQMNTMELSIYNLGKENRRRIFKSRFISQYQTVTLEAGYGSQLSLLFLGDIYEAGTIRQGSNLITTVSSRSGWYDVTTSNSYHSIKAGASQKDILKAIISDFPNLSKNPLIGNVSTTPSTRGITINDQTHNALQTLMLPLVVTYDNGRVLALQKNDVLPAVLPQIDISTGLLEVPKFESPYLSVTTLFEPRINMCQYISVVSTIEPAYNGYYKVVGIQHQGTISEAESGEMRSTFQLVANNVLFSYNRVTG